MSIQCRTMMSQRPCGTIVCTREECKAGKPQVPSVRPPFPVGKSMPMPSLERLTATHVRALMDSVLRDCSTITTVPTALKEAYRILCEADLDAKGF